MLTYILFIIGFVFLIKGADFLVSGSGSIARKLGISPLVIGLTIVSFGTSAPELVVNIMASLDGNADIAIGNIIGSNIANILLILGVAAAIYPIKVKNSTAFKEIPFSLLAVVVLFFLVNDRMLDGGTIDLLSRIDGLVLLSFFIIFMYYVFSLALNGRKKLDDEDEIEELPYIKAIFLCIAGLLGLFFGGEWIVNGAVFVAESLNISKAVIGLTIIAFGTSLPELATTVVAARKKQTDMAIGNVVGSNIFNIFWILGLSSTINPIPFNADANQDVAMVVLATMLMFAFLYVHHRHQIDRWQGYVFLAIYIVYTVYLFFR